MKKRDVNAYTVKALERIGAFDMGSVLSTPREQDSNIAIAALSTIQGILAYHDMLLEEVDEYDKEEE